MSAEVSTEALMHLHSLQEASFATVASGQHDAGLRAACISQLESQRAATHADFEIAGLDRLSTTKTAPKRRITDRALRCHNMNVIIAGLCGKTGHSAQES
jgi:hypothetical protein